MSQFFSIVDGKVLDWHFYKLDTQHYAFYIGDILVGQIYKLDNAYTGVLNKSHPYNGIGGFKTRHAAVAYLLFIGGYRDRPS